MVNVFQRLPAVLLLIVGMGSTAVAQNQPSWPAPENQGEFGHNLVQPFSGPQISPGGYSAGMTTQRAAPANLLPNAPWNTAMTVIRPLTAARPIVVELYTSEGCSSCPPADRHLAELAKRRDLLVLSYHVDYWDYIGWPDRFAMPAFGDRQRAFAKAKGKSIVYTPQIVIAGALPELGTDRVAVEASLQAARNRKVMAEPVLAKDAGGDIHLSLPATTLSVPASLWFVTFVHRDQSDVTAGENSGRRMVSVNIVRSIRKLGTWDGRARTQSIQLTAAEIAALPDACAVIANEAEFGPVVAAAAWRVRDLD